MAKEPFVDKNLCIGCGACAAVCPGTFELGEDGKSQVTDPAGCGEAEIQQAIDACPVSAISWKK